MPTFPTNHKSRYIQSLQAKIKSLANVGVSIRQFFEDEGCCLKDFLACRRWNNSVLADVSEYCALVSYTYRMIAKFTRKKAEFWEVYGVQPDTEQPWWPVRITQPLESTRWRKLMDTCIIRKASVRILRLTTMTTGWIQMIPQTWEIQKVLTSNPLRRAMEDDAEDEGIKIMFRRVHLDTLTICRSKERQLKC